jgi:signal peptidase I
MAVYFSLFLVVVTIITGIVWLADKFYLAPQRQLNVDEAQAQCSDSLTAEAIDTLLEPSALVDTSVQVFPVIAFVLILRSFLYEPFQIPSGSMMPTLLDGDFILVNKYNYGLRDPVWRDKFFEVGSPERGDVVVFKYPNEPQIDFIKRVIGLPGDRIIYRNKMLYIKAACKETDDKCPEFEAVVQDFKKETDSPDGSYGLNRYTSTMPNGTKPNKSHDILIDSQIMFTTRPFCSQARGRVCQQAGTQRDEFIVPKGQYFVMGDNRDNSLDSRYWGFVPEENLVGEAVAIWMSFDFDRTEKDLLPHWVPTNVRFSRVGGIH